MDLSLLKRIKVNQIEMMQLRGKVIPQSEQSIHGLSTQEFGSYIQNRMSNIGHPLNNVYYGAAGGGQLPVFYIQSDDGGTIKGSEVRERFINLLAEGKYTDSILIVLGKITSLKAILKESPEYNITVFDMNELLQNPTKHVYSDKVIKKLDSKEISQLTKTIKPQNLHQLCYDDPIVKFWGFEPGDVLLINDLIGDDRLMVKEMRIHKLVGTNSINNFDRNI